MFQPIFTEDQFNAALSSPRPVLLLWGQTGCGACQETKPVVRRFAVNHQDIDAYELNVNLAPIGPLADKHRIRATPTLMIFVRGARVARRSGALTLEQLERWVEKVVEGGAG